MSRMRLSDSDHSAYFLEAVQKHMQKHQGHRYKKAYTKFMERLLALKNKHPSDPSDPVLEDIRQMLCPHQYLIQEFNAFLPPCCRIEPVSQDNLKIKVLEDGLNFIQLVKERVSENEYKSFAYLLSDPNSGNESILQIEKLLSQHPDLVGKFEDFKPVSKRVSKRRKIVHQDNSKVDKNGYGEMLEKMHDLDVELRRYEKLAEEMLKFVEVVHAEDEIGSLEIRVEDHFDEISISCLKNLFGGNKDDVEKLLKENSLRTLVKVIAHFRKIYEEMVSSRQKASEAWPQLDFI